MLKKIVKLLYDVKDEAKIKLEKISDTLHLGIKDGTAYIIKIFYQKRNLTPSHFKELIEYLERRLDEVLKEKQIEAKEKRVILIMRSKLSKGTKEKIKELINGKKVWVFEIPEKFVYEPEKDEVFDKFLNILKELK